jgi:hypothetical protein
LEDIIVRMILVAIALLVSPAAFGGGLADLGEQERCTFWASNAMYGASQFMRGAAREVEFISRPRLREILMGTERVGSEKLYILDEEGYTDVERVFLVKSTLFGYDEMSAWKTRNFGFGPIKEEWWQRFMAMCLEHPTI